MGLAMQQISRRHEAVLKRLARQILVQLPESEEEAGLILQYIHALRGMPFPTEKGASESCGTNRQEAVKFRLIASESSSLV
jgi:hypothetical protein